jgi:hypothetical protein
VNGDGRVDQNDVDIVIARLFAVPDTPNPNADVNRDLRVTAADVSAVALHVQ